MRWVEGCLGSKRCAGLSEALRLCCRSWRLAYRTAAATLAQRTAIDRAQAASQRLELTRFVEHGFLISYGKASVGGSAVPETGLVSLPVVEDFGVCEDDRAQLAAGHFAESPSMLRISFSIMAQVDSLATFSKQFPVYENDGAIPQSARQVSTSRLVYWVPGST